MTAAMPLRVGTRGSPLAIIQTQGFIDLLAPLCPRGLEAVAIRTTGDAEQHRRLAEIGGKGLFAKEIHEALLDRRIDCAVHSLKDLETTLPPGIVLACTLAREDARDALILASGDRGVDPDEPFASLPRGALVGTASIRRQAQLLHARPDLAITTLRGNVQTRLDKLAAGACAASVLAYAGLKRLGLAARASAVLDPAAMVPAAGQGIVGITVREGDTELRKLLAAIDDPQARAASTAERAMLRRLDGSCRTPIGGHAVLRDGELQLTGLVARGDGSFLLKRSLHGQPGDADRIGSDLGASLRADSPPDLFD
jgi:hydroxymethylbilane synthase